jgi:hypothetical protein
MWNLCRTWKELPRNISVDGISCEHTCENSDRKAACNNSVRKQSEARIY